MRTIPKLCITGGPCSGKTSGMVRLSEKLSEKGFYPLIVPEAATLLMSGNISPVVWPRREFQTEVLRTMLGLEESFMRAAESKANLKPVLLCDRGAAEVKAYAPEEGDWLPALKANGIHSFVEARDQRYDAVFHMVTAARGAESFYTLANNKTRRETLAEARAIDDRTLAVWTGAPHLRVIDNTHGDFEGKLKKLEQEVCAALGIPVPLEIEKKYLCEPGIPPHAQHIEIEQVYLLAPGSDQIRVRKRGQHGAYTYYRTEKRHIVPGVREEKERRITAEQYAWSMQFMRPDTKPLRKTRVCFVYESQYFELDIIPRKSGDLYLLEIELTDQAAQVKIPPFIKVIKEVTDDEEYTNAWLARTA